MSIWCYTAHNLTQEVSCKKGYIPNICHKAHLIWLLGSYDDDVGIKDDRDVCTFDIYNIDNWTCCF